jgi:hypothetical protein
MVYVLQGTCYSSEATGSSRGGHSRTLINLKARNKTRIHSRPGARPGPKGGIYFDLLF